MSHDAMDTRDLLISIATAALQAAEADAAEANSELIFRPEWRPTPRTRSSATQPPFDWRQHLYSFVASQLHQSGPLQTDKPPLRPPPASQPAPAPAPRPPTAASTPPPPPARPPQSQPQEDAVAELLKRNQDVFDEIINHSFPRALGDGTASLDGFRYYMIQDKLYLETCARLKMTAVAASPNFADVETFEARHKSSLAYVKRLKETCITMLGVPESTINATPRSVELDASENFYKGSLTLRHEDALLGYYVVLLPCVVSYWRIAERLMDDPSTVKNIVYHPAWIVENYDRSSVDKYTKFINENIKAKGGVDKWNYIFRIACQLEAKLFNTGFKAPTPFRIIPDGIYFIHIFSQERVVLATQNVKGFLRPPLDKRLGGYFPRDAESSVVGMKKTGGDSEKWHVVATKDGYTIRNLRTGLYLGVSTGLDRKEGRILEAVSDPHYWWINSAPNQANQASPLHKICDSVNLRYSLHADVEVLDNVGSTNFPYTPIVARENSEVSRQMWSFASCNMDEAASVQHEKELKDRRVAVDKDTKIAELSERLEKARMVKGPLKGGKPEVTFIAVMGMSKTGKSKFINLATRTGNLRVGRSAYSCTGAVEAAVPLELDGRRIILIDTPAFDHTEKSDVEILRIIALELEAKYRQGIKLHGIIYLHRISDVRVSNSAKQFFLVLRKLCGDRAIRNVVIVTTMWNEVKAEEGRRRAADLQFTHDFFAPALEGGARLMHHTDGTVELAHSIIRSMTKNYPEPLAIQEELVDKDMDIDQTSAGKEVDRLVGERIERYEGREDDLWESSEQARKDGDRRTWSELLEESKKLRAKTTKLAKERAGQALEYKRHQHKLNQSFA